MIFCWIEAILTARLCRKSTCKKKILIKALDTEILSLEEFHCKTTQDIA